MTRRLHRCWTICIAASIVIVFSGCGSDDENPVVVRVGDKVITKVTVDHWTSVVRRGGAFTGFRGEPRGGSPRQRALVLLISSDWLIAEATRQDLSPSGRAVDDALAERVQTEGEREFRGKLDKVGQTVAGIKLEIRAELALQAIREELARRAGHLTQSEVEEFYRRHQRLFAGPATRIVDIIENLPSRAAAVALVRHVGTGRRFTEKAYHKTMAYTTGLLAGSATKKQVDKAIFAARPGVISPPMRLFDGWAVFVVRRIVPRSLGPLAKVRQSVVAHLRERRKREITKAFDSEYRRWMVRTSCTRGYAAPGCAQYGGSLAMYEDPFAL